MMAGPGADNDAGGGPIGHIPVLLPEILAALQPLAGALVVDATFGAGGYSRALLDAGASVIAIDRDPDAIAAGRAIEAAAAGRLRLAHGPFSMLDAYAEARVDGIVFDIGVSSMQLDRAERGFSFRRDGPLDMRMAQTGASAAEIVNGFKAADLARIIGLLGEERRAGRIARAIERRRQSQPFRTTRQLAEAVEAATGSDPKSKIHPATRTFQALRIFVNDELGELARGLLAAERALKPGGRLAVVSFHSLEDRIVKRFIAERSRPAAISRHLPPPEAPASTFDMASRLVVPSEAEIEANPRARSARLRVAVRTEAAAGTQDLSFLSLPKLPPVGLAGER